jgi:hypothetical protein
LPETFSESETERKKPEMQRDESLNLQKDLFQYIQLLFESDDMYPCLHTLLRRPYTHILQDPCISFLIFCAIF